jgi:hypothetical protein
MLGSLESASAHQITIPRALPMQGGIRTFHCKKRGSIEIISLRSQNVGVVAFVDPQNGKAWIGGANDLDFFIEDDSEIFDLNRNLFSGTLSWRKSLIVKAVQDEDVGGMIRRFENDVNGWWLLQTSGRTLLSSYFRQWFFYPHVMVSYVGFTPIDRIEVNREKLRIDFTSPAYQTKGSVWIDLKTWKVLKASEYK